MNQKLSGILATLLKWVYFLISVIIVSLPIVISFGIWKSLDPVTFWQKIALLVVLFSVFGFLEILLIILWILIVLWVNFVCEVFLK